MAKITKINYSPKPNAQQAYDFEILSENFDPNTETFVLKISTDFYFPVFDHTTKTHKITIPATQLSIGAGSGGSVKSLRAYTYDFKKNENTYAATSQMKLYNSNGAVRSTVSFASFTAVDDSTQPWVSGLAVTEVKGPFQDNKLVSKIDLNKPTTYRAVVGGKTLSLAQFLTLKWSYSINGGPKTRFKNNNKSIDPSYTDFAEMSCQMLKDWVGKEIKVYAFFRSESENVVASAIGTNAPNSSPNDPSSSSKGIVFPLLVKPENDPGNKWGTSYYWAAAQRNNMATFNSNRSGGRRHAGRDLYTKPLETVVAMCAGEVLNVSPFYSRTDQVTILHTTADGKKFMVRYGELDPASITVKAKDKVVQKQVLGKTGKLLDSQSKPLLKLNGTIVYMLHFEVYSGDAGWNLNSPLTNSSTPFKRRSDLLDPLTLLKEAYANTFELSDETPVTSTTNRKAIATLSTSEKGKDFIKSWESYRKNAYNDSEGFCTIGYGHLIARKKCENLTLPTEFQNGISEAKASELLNMKIQEFETAIKRDIQVPLHQHEFDALLSLVYNTGPNFLSKGGRNNGPTKIMTKINSLDYAGGASEFADVTNGGVTGLVNRRKAEIEIFLNNNYVNH